MSIVFDKYYIYKIDFKKYTPPYILYIYIYDLLFMNIIIKKADDIIIYIFKRNTINSENKALIKYIYICIKVIEYML